MKLSLNKQSCNSYLEKYLELGYKNSKLFSIKEGAFIAKYVRLLNGNEKDEKISEKNIYDTIFQVLELMNKNGAFTLGDASVLEMISVYVKEKILVPEKEISKKEVPEPKEVEEPKIKEI